MLRSVFVVGVLGRYQSNPSIDHWRAAKKVMRYLQGTKDYMLMCNTPKYTLVVFNMFRVFCRHKMNFQ